MPFISMQGISLAFLSVPLFDGVNLTIERGEKVGLVGRNGSGKSTLLRLIEGSAKPDSGAVSVQKGVRSAYLSQEVPHDLLGTVFDVVASGSREYVDLITRNPSPSASLLHEGTVPVHEELDRIHQNLDMEGVWYKKEQVSKCLSQLGVDAGLAFSSLSAGLNVKCFCRGRLLVSRISSYLMNQLTTWILIPSRNWNR